MNLIVNTRYNERRLTIFTSNYQDTPDDTDPNSLIFRIGYRMRSRLHEMCEFIEMDGADYRELPVNGGVDDLITLWKMRKKTLPARAGRQARAQLKAPDGKGSICCGRAAKGHVNQQSSINNRQSAINKSAICNPQSAVRNTPGPPLIPFCSSICNYCNFNRGLFDGELKNRYVAALEREISTAGRGEAVDTIFFGGGTPSLLDPGEIERLITACRNSFTIARDAEVTLETNPETSTRDRMSGFRAAGVNRVSFGVQSFRDVELKRLGRIHSAERARDAVTEARAAGFANVSLDLMMWLPQQTRADWSESVDALIQVSPEHASLYLLELYPNAPLKEDMARAGWSCSATTRRRCIYGAWIDSIAPGICSTRSRTWLVPASSRATISNTGKMASGLGSAVGRIPRATASAGRMSPPPRSTLVAFRTDSPSLQSSASCHANHGSRRRSLPVSACAPGSTSIPLGANTKRTSGRAMATRFNPHSRQAWPCATEPGCDFRVTACFSLTKSCPCLCRRRVSSARHPGNVTVEYWLLVLPCRSVKEEIECVVPSSFRLLVWHWRSPLPCCLLRLPRRPVRRPRPGTRGAGEASRAETRADESREAAGADQA
jgi:molybdenum cofactor biosynthesis enzyme MoaA